MLWGPTRKAAKSTFSPALHFPPVCQVLQAMGGTGLRASFFYRMCDLEDPTAAIIFKLFYFV